MARDYREWIWDAACEHDHSRRSLDEIWYITVAGIVARPGIDNTDDWARQRVVRAAYFLDEGLAKKYGKRTLTVIGQDATYSYWSVPVIAHVNITCWSTWLEGADVTVPMLVAP